MENKDKDFKLILNINYRIRYLYKNKMLTFIAVISMKMPIGYYNILFIPLFPGTFSLVPTVRNPLPISNYSPIISIFLG